MVTLTSWVVIPSLTVQLNVVLPKGGEATGFGVVVLLSRLAGDQL